MLLPRTRSGINALSVSIDTTAAETGVSVRVGLKSRDGDNTVDGRNVILNKEDLDNLVVMLQYYRQEVWPDDEKE